MRSPLRWRGGKTRLCVEIVKRIEPHSCYVEVFCGAGHILFHKEPSRVEVINDINGELMNFFRVIANDADGLLKKLEWALISREEFERLKAQDVAKLDSLERAWRFYYLLRNGYGGMGRAFGVTTKNLPTFNAVSAAGVIREAHRRLCHVIIENLQWREIIRRYDRPHTFFYLDPPYYGHEKDYGRKIFGRMDFRDMARLLKGISGKFLLSLNDLPETRAIFKEFYQLPVTTLYTSGKDNSHKAKELLIANYKELLNGY